MPNSNQTPTSTPQKVTKPSVGVSNSSTHTSSSTSPSSSSPTTVTKGKAYQVADRKIAVKDVSGDVVVIVKDDGKEEKVPLSLFQALSPKEVDLFESAIAVDSLETRLHKLKNEVGFENTEDVALLTASDDSSTDTASYVVKYADIVQVLTLCLDAADGDLKEEFVVSHKDLLWDTILESFGYVDGVLPWDILESALRSILVDMKNGPPEDVSTNTTVIVGDDGTVKDTFVTVMDEAFTFTYDSYTKGKGVVFLKESNGKLLFASNYKLICEAVEDVNDVELVRLIQSKITQGEQKYGFKGRGIDFLVKGLDNGVEVGIIGPGWSHYAIFDASPETGSYDIVEPDFDDTSNLFVVALHDLGWKVDGGIKLPPDSLLRFFGHLADSLGNTRTDFKLNKLDSENFSIFAETLFEEKAFDEQALVLEMREKVSEAYSKIRDIQTAMRNLSKSRDVASLDPMFVSLNQILNELFVYVRKHPDDEEITKAYLDIKNRYTTLNSLYQDMERS